MSYSISSIVESFFEKDTAVKRLQKYWINFCKAHKIDMAIYTEEGNLASYWITMDDLMAGEVDLDESNLVNYLLQDQYINGDTPVDSFDIHLNAGNETVRRTNLAGFLEALENECQYDVRQFEVTPSRVHGLVDKIIAVGNLYEPIELGYTGNKPPIFLSGRHRACALMTIFSVIENYLDLQLHVKVTRFKSEEQLIECIETRNGSRSMTQQEKGFLALAKKGIDPNDTDQIFEDVTSGLTALPRVFEAYFMNTLDTATLGITTSTAGAIGRKVAALLKGKYNNANVLEPKTRLFLKDPTIVREIAETAVEDGFENPKNWEVLKGRCKVETTDDEGNKSYSFNISRNVDKIATPLALELAKEFQHQLDDALVQLEAKKEARAKKQKATDAERKAKKVQEAMKLLASQGITEIPMVTNS